MIRILKKVKIYTVKGVENEVKTCTLLRSQRRPNTTTSDCEITPEPGTNQY